LDADVADWADAGATATANSHCQRRINWQLQLHFVVAVQQLL
jgi:hypothetical protein